MAHTFDPARSNLLEDVGRYRFCSRDELVDLLEADESAVAVDMGSGTGFYTRDVAPALDAVYGLDVQPVMHAKFQERGVPPNVELVAADAAHLPLLDGSVDVVYSTMTFHEFAGTGAMTEIERVLRSGGRFVAVDWSAAGEGADGPPREGRLDLASAIELVESAGFEVAIGRERPETFVLAADLPG